MNRDGYPCLSDVCFADLYSLLTLYTELYDNAEREIQIVLSEILLEYSKKHHVDIENAIPDLKQIKHESNSRNAGRKPKFTEEQRQKMYKLLEDGMSKKDIAVKYQCSISYVEKLYKSIHG
ncbi:MAG: helix-turn-helix domain-containing protein [Clostridia bacterium]|nr:helix-turn-helix domain-containing protein [Clostridia bacterium]MBR1708057.1 helix-turn-helix domain-containing protein [Clostridia bacterium]